MTTTVRRQSDDSQNNIENHKKASETKDEQSMTLDKRIGKSSPTPIGDKIPEKETKKQLIEALVTIPIKKMM